ncbi:hypothetical protein [Streptomyces sp. NPDC020817]|uniref:hypothetical protein n=1 Tax=Streptomyces sp. NPDC020817 TaxID=3365095 RepID=UPI0037A7C511
MWNHLGGDRVDRRRREDGNQGAAVLAASVAEALAIVVLAWQILVYAAPFRVGDSGTTTSPGP